MSLLMTVTWFLIAISILVAVHEFGHFYVARRCGIKVLRFSIGFGPKLFAVRDRSGTEFALSAIPLGGYVKMLDEREGNVDESERHLSHNSKSVQARIAVAAAGPLANIILAFVFYWAILLNGTVVYSPVIGSVEEGSLAHHAGLAEGQEIISVDGEATQGRREVVLALINRLGESGDIRVLAKYPDDDLSYESVVKISDWMRGVEEPDPLAGLGIQFYYPPLGKEVGQLIEDGAAVKAGFQVGDELVAVDGRELRDWQQWVEIIRANPETELSIEVLRADQMIALNLTPAQKSENGETIGYAGMGVKLPKMPENMRRVVHYNVFEALGRAADETAEAVSFVFISLKKLVLGEISIKNLSGPIGIAKVAADQAQYGFWAFISFMAHVSVILAVINMLPIPVLDGGHILFYVVEWIKGSPVSESMQLMGLKAGMALLMCVMVVAFYNDILRL